MRVEIWDNVGQMRMITSCQPRLIGDWFAEQASELMTADARMQDCRLNIWPQTREEIKTIGEHREVRLDQDGLLQLAEKILEASKALADDS